MPTKETVLVLKGAYEGQTIVLAGVQFVEGRATIVGGDDLAGLIRVLRRSYQAIPEEELHGESAPDSERLERAVPEVESEVSSDGRPPEGAADESTDDARSPAGDSGLRSEGDGQGRPASEVRAIEEALSRLDPSDDEHWTEAGKPRVDVVADKSGVAGLKRADIERFAPELRRIED